MSIDFGHFTKVALVTFLQRALCTESDSISQLFIMVPYLNYGYQHSPKISLFSVVSCIDFLGINNSSTSLDCVCKDSQYLTYWPRIKKLPFFHHDSSIINLNNSSFVEKLFHDRAKHQSQRNIQIFKNDRSFKEAFSAKNILHFEIFEAVNMILLRHYDLLGRVNS